MESNAYSDAEGALANAIKSTASANINLFPLLSIFRNHADVSDAFAFSFSSSFLRAAKIISSRLRCRFACLSVLSCDHAFCFGCSSDAAVSELAAILDERL